MVGDMSSAGSCDVAYYDAALKAPESWQYSLGVVF